MKRPPVARDRIYDLYWYFAAERHAIFERRVSGASQPWTDDPILRSFKFCNVYRAADRVSQYLIRNAAYNSEPIEPLDRLFQIIACRIFSKVETWESVRSCLGRYPTLEDLRSGDFARSLSHVKAVNGGLYTGAFILCANNAYGHSEKHLNHVELFQHMFLRESLGERIMAATTLREVYELLHSFPLMGDFMSYQIAIDLNYSDLMNFSENDFTQAGPGALRGIKKAFSSLGDYSATDTILWMVDRQQEEFTRLALDFHGLWGRPLHAIDCQGLFCELDKYCREAAPELASARQRIKARYVTSAQSIYLFFPPKWGLNVRLPRHKVLGTTTGGQFLQTMLF